MHTEEKIGVHIGSNGFTEVNQDSAYLISKNNTPVGGYDITGGNGKQNSIMFMMVKKPKWHHRFFCKLLLGWNWVD